MHPLHRPKSLATRRPVCEAPPWSYGETTTGIELGTVSCTRGQGLVPLGRDFRTTPARRGFASLLPAHPWLLHATKSRDCGVSIRQGVERGGLRHVEAARSHPQPERPRGWSSTPYFSCSSPSWSLSSFLRWAIRSGTSSRMSFAHLGQTAESLVRYSGAPPPPMHLSCSQLSHDDLHRRCVPDISHAVRSASTMQPTANSQTHP